MTVLVSGCFLQRDRVIYDYAAPTVPPDRPKIAVPEAPVGRIIVEPTPAGGPGSRAVSGRASWFDVGGGLYAAAGPAIRWKGWRGDKVRVCSGTKCVVVVLNDWCQCFRNEPRERIIDLSPDAFGRLGSLSAGVIKVTVEKL